MNERLAALLQGAGVWRARSPVDDTRRAGVAAAHVVATGWPRLDAQLATGGWPLGTLVELLLPEPGAGELRLLLPALRTLGGGPGAGQERWLALIGTPHAPYPPALAQGGIRPERLLLIAAATRQDRLWAMEQALRSDGCTAVLAWFDAVDDRWLRRLKLAAERGRALAVLLRPLDARRTASPAALRLVLEPTPAALDVHVLKGRGCGPRQIRDVFGCG
jgi:protein ImuA